MKRQTEILGQASPVIQSHSRKGTLREPETIVRIGARHGHPPNITLYVITENELADLARGGRHSAHSAWGLTLLATATAFLISLLTTTMSLTLFILFVVLAAGGYGAALPLLLFWFKEHKSTSNLLEKIKSRLQVNR
jgi:Flp pilus assembly protein TadB